MNIIEEMKLKLTDPTYKFSREEMQRVLTEYNVLETRYIRLRESVMQSGKVANQTLDRICQKIKEL